MSVLLVLNVNILAARAIDQSCGIGLVFSVIHDREGVKQKRDRGGEGGGGYSRAAINRGMAIIRGFTVFVKNSSPQPTGGRQLVNSWPLQVQAGCYQLSVKHYSGPADDWLNQADFTSGTQDGLEVLYKGLILKVIGSP